MTFENRSMDNGAPAAPIYVNEMSHLGDLWVYINVHSNHALESEDPPNPSTTALPSVHLAMIKCKTHKNLRGKAHGGVPCVLMVARDRTFRDPRFSLKLTQVGSKAAERSSHCRAAVPALLRCDCPHQPGAKERIELAAVTGAVTAASSGGCDSTGAVTAASCDSRWRLSQGAVTAVTAGCHRRCDSRQPWGEKMGLRAK
jgi:hypothetical protein